MEETRGEEPVGTIERRAPCFVVKVDSFAEDDVSVEGRKIDRNLEATTLSQQWGKSWAGRLVIAAAGSE